MHGENVKINPLNTKLNPICHLLALLGARHILDVSRIRVNIFYSTVSRGTPNDALRNPVCETLT
jgi:hypothetical protein